MYASIQSEDGYYWQCGSWVPTLEDATKYPSTGEACSVIAMRHLDNASVIANATTWRDLRPQKKDHHGFL